jgi:hypothetical protein
MVAGQALAMIVSLEEPRVMGKCPFNVLLTVIESEEPAGETSVQATAEYGCPVALLLMFQAASGLGANKIKECAFREHMPVNWPGEQPGGIPNT